ncbi:MAG TPA: hypothetical protein HA348_07840 [Thermoplasmata archaeon]|nr:hypothetical protein [Thermoplasmata archaeon]
MKNRSRIKATLALGLALIFLFIADSSTFLKVPKPIVGKKDMRVGLEILMAEYYILENPIGGKVI